MKKKEVILIKLGEIVLKGLNKKKFEYILIRNIEKAIKELGKFNITCVQSTITIEPLSENVSFNKIENKLKKVFGIANFVRALRVTKDMGDIERNCVKYLKEELQTVKTFKIEAKRADKKFILKSPEICAQVGAFVLKSVPNLKVDVLNPEIIIYIEIRDKYAFIRTAPIKGAGGLPVGSGGKAAVLLSGGIDSPVATYLMAKRGLTLSAIHFSSPPYTSQLAFSKVKNLICRLSEYCGSIMLINVPFTAIQERIHSVCEKPLTVIVMRRIMLKIASRLSDKFSLSAIVTGESLGQVASQTIDAIVCTDVASTKPVLRPLIGMDKEDIVKVARSISTFDISIEPFEDCCTVFVPKHPQTKPRLKLVEVEERKSDFDLLIEDAVNNISITYPSEEE